MISVRFARHSLRASLAVLAAAAGYLTATSCGGHDIAGPPVVSAVLIAPGPDTLTALGATRGLSATAKDANGGTLSTAIVRWHSSLPGVVAIDSISGVATAVANGTAVITASVGGIQAQIDMTVAQVVATVLVSPSSPSFTTIGDTVRLSATAKDSLGVVVSGVRFLWVATNPAVATVDTLGLVTARGAGAGFVTAAGRGVPGSVPVSVVQNATQLAFTIQPTGTTAGAALSPALQVEVRDAGGHLVTSARNAITMAIGTNPGGGSLTGTATVNAVGGIATYSGLAIAKSATGYTLAASASGMTGATSSAFDVAPGVAAQLVFLRQPPARVEGNVAIDSIVVAVRDSFGNPAPTGSVFVYFASAQWPGATLSGATTQAISSDGTASFIAAVTIDKPGQYRLTAQHGLAIGTSAPFNVGLTFQQLAVGERHACGITTGGTYCWGDNEFGELGISTLILRDSTPRLVPGGLTFTQIAAGGTHVCALTSAGAAYCWGNNSSGQIGSGNNNFGAGPTLVTGGHVFLSLSAGDASNCGIATDTFTYCWGANGSSQLGDSTTSNRNAPTQVKGGIAFTQVAVRYNHACGITAAGVAYCWGDNTFGQVGDSSFTPRPGPVPVKTPLVFTNISVGYDASCGTTVPSGIVWCWGSNGVHQLGLGAGLTQSAPNFATINSGTSLAMFGQFGCSLSSTQYIMCWGDNALGQLGEDARISDTSWLIGAGAMYFDRLAVGFDAGCGRRAGDGVVFCWGANPNGEIGDGSSLNIRRGPVRIVQ